MNLKRRQILGGVTAATASAALMPFAAEAQAAWPNKSIRIVCGYPAGGLTDALARANAEYLGQKLGQAVVVENKAGAAGMLAGAEVAKAAPDGYTFWFTITGTLNQNRVLFKKMPYDPDRDFAYVSGFGAGHLPLAVNANSPIRNMRDLVEMGRKQPITLGNYSAGSLPHMVAQQLSKKYGMQVACALQGRGADVAGSGQWPDHSGHGQHAGHDATAAIGQGAPDCRAHAGALASAARCADV